MRSKQFWYFMSRALVVVAVALIMVNGAWAANAEKVLHSFTGGNDGIDPAATLAADAAGNFYGTTVSGGTGTLCANGCGTVFELSPVAGGKWKETVLYSFTGGSDGKNPYGGVTLDSKGDLYGTTVAGGSGGTCSWGWLRCRVPAVESRQELGGNCDVQLHRRQGWVWPRRHRGF